MPLPAHLSALKALRPLVLLLPALGWAADLALLARDGSVTLGQPKLSGGGLVVGAANVPLDRLVGVGGPATPPRWLDEGVMLANGDLLRGTILGVQKGSLSLVSDLLGPLEVPVAEVSAVVTRPQRAGQALSQGFTGALFVNGDRLPGQVAYVDERNVGIDNGRKVVAIPRERVSAVVLRPCVVAAQSKQMLRLANGDRVSGQLKAWGPTGLELVSARGTVRCTVGELSALWSEGAGQRPFTSAVLVGLTPGVGIDVLPGGMPLAAGSRRYGHGLGVRGAASVAVATDGAVASLIGEVVVLEGRVTVTVLADDKTAWDSGALAAGDAAKPFTATVAGAKQVRVVVAPVDDAAPLVVVGWPTLVN